MSTHQTSNLVLTDEFEEALSHLERGENLFLTGKAGTGKSTLIRHFLATTSRNVVVAAPTGIAALNVEGYTIHRLFSFHSTTTVEHVRSPQYFPRRFIKTLRNLDTLIIDEASMVRADLFDCLAVALERFGPKRGTPFGGVQLILVGDLYQLPPVVLEAENEYFSTRYATPYFFSADHYDQENFPLVELTKVFRQVGDSRLVDILNDVREGALLEEARTELNTRTDSSFRPPIDEFWLTLTGTNKIAAARNREMLDQIPDPELRHKATCSGDLDDFIKPTEDNLAYKVGAQIMLLTNDQDEQWVNGSIGRIADHRVKEGETVVTVELPDIGMVEVSPHTWDVTRPVVDSGVLRHEVIGNYTQLPFRLAWAITIHKSQGQTLDRLVVDLTGGTFAYGQLYVALSRCTSMDGIVLRRGVEPKDLKVDQRIRRFLRSGGTETQTRGNVYLGICTVGDVGRTWRPRPVEIALVTDDGTEVTTLINPTRDLGDARTSYGITASDVLLAPLLIEAWAALAPHLAGRTPVGIHIDRDLGYLDYELKRNGYVAAMPIGIEIDGSDLSEQERENLNAPCALDRARALRDIAKCRPPADAFADVFPDPEPRTGYLLTREQRPSSFSVGGVIFESSNDEEILAEHLRTTAERSRDRLNDQTRALFQKLEEQLGQPILDPNDGNQEQQAIGSVLVPGARVCFSGTYYTPERKKVDKSVLESLALTHGLEPVDKLTKKDCDVLVCAEAGAQSKKADKAILYGKPIFSADEFLAWTAN